MRSSTNTLPGQGCSAHCTNTNKTDVFFSLLLYYYIIFPFLFSFFLFKWSAACWYMKKFYKEKAKNHEIFSNREIDKGVHLKNSRNPFLLFYFHHGTVFRGNFMWKMRKMILFYDEMKEHIEFIVLTLHWSLYRGTIHS